MTDKELALEICKEIRSAHRKICLPYRLEAGESGITDSKVGGTPYLPEGEHWPEDAKGVPMCFLAQIDCTQLAALPDFPHTGLLQFFTGADDVFGADFDDPACQRTFRVLYWETAAPSVTAADLHCPTPPELWYTPLCGGPCRIIFGQSKIQELPGEDYLFEKLFLEQWNQRRPEKPLKDLWSFYHLFPREERDYSIFDAEPDEEEVRGPRHQLDGYPYFTQIDPRRENVDLAGFDTLLFQLDSDMPKGSKDLVLWGDCGVGNFFINREDLKRRDFSRVLYNWDCC